MDTKIIIIGIIVLLAIGIGTGVINISAGTLQGSEALASQGLVEGANYNLVNCDLNTNANIVSSQCYATTGFGYGYKWTGITQNNVKLTGYDSQYGYKVDLGYGIPCIQTFVTKRECIQPATTVINGQVISTSTQASTGTTTVTQPAQQVSVRPTWCGIPIISDILSWITNVEC